MKWLFKTEPSDYSFERLVREKKTLWIGVKNALALKHLRQVRKGDEIAIYHTGGEKAVVGIAKVVSNPYPEDKSEKYVAVDLVPVGRLPRPVTLAEIKADPTFKEFPLVRISRLSVMPVSEREWREIESMARELAAGRSTARR